VTKLAPLVVAALAVLAAPAQAAPRRFPASTPTPTPLPPVAPHSIAFLGLRPTDGAAFGTTALGQLAEAQRLRGVAENVVGLLSGAPVLGHEDLRKLASPTYLVELFDCRGEVACQLRIAAPLRARGVRTAVSGELFAESEAFRIRLRRLDLAAARLLDEVTFTIPRASADTLPPWREALQRMFLDTGSLRVVSNVPDPSCQLDGRPCEVRADGLIANVAEGEHVVEIAKEGYRRGVRVVTVKRGEEQRVALPLEELPVQAGKAPDPANRVPVFAAPGETTRLAPFGFMRLAMGWDDRNGGDREDQLAPPRGPASSEGHLLVLPRPAVLGVTIQAPRQESGWQLRGALSTAWVKDATPEIDSAYAELLREDAGFRVVLGFGPGIVSGLTAGTLTLPEGFGDLAAGFIGLTVSKSFGDVVFEGFVGRHKSQFAAVAVPGAATPGPFVGGRVALVEEGIEGKLYGEKYPLTIAVSGLYGTERVGLDAEAEFLGTAATPVRQDSPVWVGSLEVHLPFGKRASLAGEGWLGQNVHILEGAAWQGPRVDPVTGRHTALRSAGGWAQLSLNLGPVELRLIGGLDRVLRGLDAGVAAGAGPAVSPIRENRLVAVNGVWYLLQHLGLGAQVHAIETRYQDPALGRSTLLGAVFTSQLKF
jgi:hypothetical protein